MACPVDLLQARYLCNRMSQKGFFGVKKEGSKKQIQDLIRKFERMAVDNDPGVRANLTVQDTTSEDVTATDVLNGYQQSITTTNENGNLTIQNLIIRDYPLILRVTK